MAIRDTGNVRGQGKVHPAATRRMPASTILQGVLAALMAAGLAGCGGGGGQVGSTPPPRPAPTPVPSPTPTPTPVPTPPPGQVIVPPSQQPVRSAEDDAEYRRNYTAFEYVDALYALDAGWTGQGVTVGVLDDGVRETSELAGQLSALSRDFGTVTQGGVTRPRGVIGDDDSDHGTLVASVIAARNDGTGIQGIAPDAQLAVLRIGDIDLDESDPEERETLGVGLAEAMAYAGRQGIRVVNASLVKLEPETRSATWSRMVADFGATGGLFVNSAGNESADDAAGYLDLNAANRDAWLFVVALDGSRGGYELAGYSNQCGTAAMDRCISAMGTNAAQDIDGSLVLFSGTSSAAPQVSGLAALILSKWPQLTGIEAGEVILSTARDIGAAGIDPVFGHGLIDVRAALAPVSPVLTTAGGTVAITGASMVVPEAMGGASAVTGALGSVTVLDAFGRDFTGDLSGLVARPQAVLRGLERRLAYQSGYGASQIAAPGLHAEASFVRLAGQGAGQAGANQGPAMLTSASLALQQGRTWISVGYNSGDRMAEDVMGLAPDADIARAYAPHGQWRVGLTQPFSQGRIGIEAIHGEAATGFAAGRRNGPESARVSGIFARWQKAGTSIKAGILDERGTVFGSPTGTGALRLGDGASTALAEIAHHTALSGWRIESYASVGLTRLKLGPDMVLADAETLVSGRMAVTAGRRALGGELRLGLAQPLTVLAGGGTYVLGGGYVLAERALRLDSRQVDFRGKIDPLLTLGYARRTSRSDFGLGIAARGDGSDLQMLGRWRLVLP